jgi:hypothetical protein
MLARYSLILSSLFIVIITPSEARIVIPVSPSVYDTLLRISIIFIVVVVLLNVVLKIVDVAKRRRSRDRK